MDKTKEIDSKDKQMDTNLLSRQIATVSMETMKEIMKLKVLIIGLKGLGVEIAKNLILLGPAQVDIYDQTIAELRDMGANFYLKEEHIGKLSRADACLPSLIELNKYVQVRSIKKIPEIKEYKVVVQTEFFPDIDPFVLNESCRNNKIGYILSLSFGLSGHIFVDFGNEFTIKDQDGADTKKYIINGIFPGDPTIVSIVKEKEAIKYGDNESVRITEVEGMEEINSKPNSCYTLEIVNATTFKLNVDSTKFSNYVKGGIIENIKLPKCINFESLMNSLTKPLSKPSMEFIITDFKNYNQSKDLHFGLQIMFAYYLKKKELPQTLSKEDLAEFIKISEELYEEQKKNKNIICQNVNKQTLEFMCSYARCQHTSMCSYLGGIVAQEIIKIVGKYTPIQQWYHYDFFNCIPPNSPKKVFSNSRYCDQIALFGEELHDKLTKLKVFIVGAGAIGCEILKCWALMGISTNGGLITCTDHDTIELSNLNRQFLFRRENIGHSKSTVACDVVKKINSSINISSHVSKVGPDNEQFFNYEFFSSQNLIVTAVDNIIARKYLDDKAGMHLIPLLESGTQGCLATNMVIYPNKTQRYVAQEAGELYPMCTIRNFPNLVEHCIEWGRDLFEGLFVNGPADAQLFINSPSEFFEKLKTLQSNILKMEVLAKVQNYLVIQKSSSKQALIEISLVEFFEYFNEKIKTLIYLYPKDHLDKNGLPFWSGEKRFPQQILFDPLDKMHFLFIKAYSNLLSYIFGMGIIDDKDIEVYFSTIKDFSTFKSNIKLTALHNKLIDEDIKDSDIESFESTLASNFKTCEKKFRAVVFEKDDDTNFHIDFIHAASSLRARNFHIKETDWNRTKFVAGRIIPALATTTALIVGIVQNELIKVTVNTPESIKLIRNGSFDIGLSFFNIIVPAPPTVYNDSEDPIIGIKTKTVPGPFTSWDSIHIKGPLKIQEFIDMLKSKYQVKCDSISIRGTALFNTDWEDCTSMLDYIIEDYYCLLCKKKKDMLPRFLEMNISGMFIPDKSCVAILPKILYEIPKTNP